MPQDYEFNMLVDVHSLQEPVDWETLDFGEAVGIRLPMSANGLRETLQSLPGTGWEVVSHDVMTHRNLVIVTYLLRRPYQG